MEPDARILLLRHGQAEADGVCYGRRLDPPLSTAGIVQARRAAERLELHHVDRVVVSPAARALGTLAHLQAGGLPEDLGAAVDEAWCERDFGRWEGRPWDELWAEAPDEVRIDPAAYASFTPPEGETWPSVASRVGGALDALASAGGTTLVVTHAGPIRAALALSLDVPAATAFAFAVPHGRAVAIARFAAASVVEGVGW